MGFATDAIHAGQEPDPTTGAIMTPIYQTSTYVLEELGKTKGFDYARTINPTRLALERNLAALEGGEKGFCFASGMSAIAAVMTLMKQGDHVVVSNMTYGGTFRLFEQVLKGYGLEFTYVDTSDLAATEKALRPKTRMLYLETPTNPLMGLTDLEAAARLAKQHSLISVVDNTFMSPYFQKPLTLGIDIVLHSTTKFLNGHSDSVGGCVVTPRPEHAERIGFVQNAVGAILSPFDSWLVLRGVSSPPSTPGSSCAASRRFISGCSATTRTVGAWPTSSPGTPRSSASSTRAFRPTPSTSWRSGSARDSAG